MLLSIANTTLKELIHFLRKECKLNIKDLEDYQKISINTMLMSAHSWMARTSVDALDTFLNFISRKFINRHKMITKQQAIHLYTLLARRTNDRNFDIAALQP